MTGGAVAVLLASLLGSVHCAAMCGGFVCWYAGAEGARDARMLRAHAMYNVGRLVAYVSLGAAAGALGVGVTHYAAVAGIARGATIVAGMVMIVWAGVTIATLRGVRVSLFKTPPALQRSLGQLLESVRNQPVAVRAGVMGLATGLIPCGWLYVFVATAGGTGSVMDAMLVMAVFWAGTVPAMVGVGVGAQRVFGPLRAKLPALSATVVMLIGLLTLTGRLSMAVTHGH